MSAALIENLYYVWQPTAYMLLRENFHVLTNLCMPFFYRTHKLQMLAMTNTSCLYFMNFEILMALSFLV